MIRPRARRLLAALIAPLLPALGGCYAYSPAGTLPEAGSEVRLRLNERGSEAVAAQTALSSRQVLEGRLVELRGSEVRVVFSRAARDRFTEGGRSRYTVSLDTAGIETAELKQLETAKTAALLGVVTAGAVGIGIAAVSGGGSGSTPPGGNGGNPFGITVPLTLP